MPCVEEAGREWEECASLSTLVRGKVTKSSKAM